MHPLPPLLPLQVYCMQAGCPDATYARCGHFCYSKALAPMMAGLSEADCVGERCWMPGLECNCTSAGWQLVVSLQPCSFANATRGGLAWGKASPPPSVRSPCPAAFLSIFDCLPKCFPDAKAAAKLVAAGRPQLTSKDARRRLLGRHVG